MLIHMREAAAWDEYYKQHKSTSISDGLKFTPVYLSIRKSHRDSSDGDKGTHIWGHRRLHGNLFA